MDDGIDNDMMDSDAPVASSSPAEEFSSVSAPIEVARELLTLARQLIDQGKPSQALQANTMAAQPPPLVPINNILDRRLWKGTRENNWQLDDENISCPNMVIVSILKGHPMWQAFNNNTSIPQVYLQQLWHTLTRQANHFTATVGPVNVRISLSLLRTILHIPQRDHYPHMNDFQEFASEDDICQAILNLGYEGDLNRLTDFRRKNLTQPWQTLFLLVNKCLTGKHSGFDKASKNVFRIFHGLAYNLHYDFAQCIWEDLVDFHALEDTDRKAKTIPYIRFFSLLVRHFMNNPLIPARLANENFTPKSLTRITQDRYELHEQGAVLPDFLLILGDQEDLHIVCYRQDHNLVAQIDHAQGAQATSEDPNVSDDEEEEEDEDKEGGEDESDDNDGDGNDDDDNNNDGDNEATTTRVIPEEEKQKKAKSEICRLKRKAAGAARAEKEAATSKIIQQQPEEDTVRSETSDELEEALEASKKLSEEAPKTISGRAELVGSGSDVFSTGVEDTDRPAVQAQASPSHLSPSQQGDDLFEHEDITHNLGDPSVTAPQVFVAAEEFRQTIAALQDNLYQEIRRSSKQKATTREEIQPKSPPRQQPSNTIPDNVTIDDLKTALIIRLLASNPQAADASLLTEIKALKSKIDEQSKEIKSLKINVRKLTREVHIIRQDCKSQGRKDKRKHDGSDDLDPL